MSQAPCVERVFVYAKTGAKVHMGPKDVAMDAEVADARPFAPCVPMAAEDTLFLLYTSGSTGKPKGVAHTTAGYLLYAALTHKLVFDVRPGDVYACMADAGWVTGHSVRVEGGWVGGAAHNIIRSRFEHRLTPPPTPLPPTQYVIYGPLTNGSTSLLFESTPLYPDPSRYWDVVQRHKVTQFYTAPTAIRALMRFGDAPVRKHDLSSLRVLGSVGEPINDAAWRWYHTVVGGGRCSVVDTYWQTVRV